MHSPQMLRDLFAVMLQVCAMSNPNQLWINHQESLSEDILHQVRSLGELDLKSIGLPQPNQDFNTVDDVLRERTYNVSELRKSLEENEDKRLPDQREIFQKITESVFQETGGTFF
ncbi:ATP-dependent DNA helicase [Trichonephila inaurata madagascariensis]|uniref:ATP-dependent DNA helicase n=1 Tax=Trichonephila inaurata madagascariensis TaxID=2747483 RepID=A0A8X6YW20_9ARAC|nr:ATP-dependent DNA helicase [Trichonephila inaurata madagascariensis]